MSTEEQTAKTSQGRTYSLAMVLVIAALSALVGAFVGASMKSQPAAAPSLLPAPSPSDERAAVIGEPADTIVGNAVTLYSLDPSDKRPIGLADASDLWIAEVEWCASPSQDPVPIENLVGLFSIQLQDSTRLSAQIVDAGPKTLAASTGTVSASDCVRGVIPFAIPKGQRPVEVVFSGASMIRWQI